MLGYLVFIPVHGTFGRGQAPWTGMKAISLQYMTSSSTVPTLRPVSLHPTLGINNLTTTLINFILYPLCPSPSLFLLFSCFFLVMCCSHYHIVSSCHHVTPPPTHSALSTITTYLACPSHHPYISYQPCHVLFITTDEEPRLGQNVWLILTVPSVQSPG